ncbi:MAG: hypothetical protein V1921_00870 [Candidatus Altiarchaeota archaeon]
MEIPAGCKSSGSLSLLRKYCSVLALILLYLISPALAETTCEVTPDRVCGDGDPWYGTILINAEGNYNSAGSAAVDINNNVMSGASTSDCFVKIVAVQSDGDSWCLTPAGVAYACPSMLNLHVANYSEAFSGEYSVLGDPILYINPSTGVPDPDNGNYTVVDADWEFVGINESHEVSEIYNIRKREEPDFSVVKRIVVYTLVRGCDNIELIGGINCKNEKLTQVDYDVLGGEADTVYYKNLQNRGYTPCEYFVIDYGKFYRYPGVYFVLLNKSKFGSNRGLSYYSIVGQEDSRRGISRLYEESIRSHEFYDPSDRVCCRYSTATGGVSNYKCVSYEQCEACAFGTSCSEVAPSYCADQTPICCGMDCSSGDFRELRSVYNSILIWNWEAGPRVVGCDLCGPGNVTCSMGSSLSAYYAHPSKNIRIYPPYYPDRYCGYYFEPRQMIGTCDCVTGENCGEDDCARCSRMGYGCRWDTAGINECLGCHYSIEPTAQPDLKLIDKSVKSIETALNETFITWSEWWCNSCGKNMQGGNDGPWGLIQGEGATCMGLDNDTTIPCSLYDCKVPWNCSDPQPVGNNWNYPSRGAGVGYIYYIAQGSRDYGDYLTDVDPTNCSDYVTDSDPPYFLNDRYSKCYNDGSTWKCNCTRPEHVPKQHTPCECPSGSYDCCIEYVDYDDAQTFLINEEKAVPSPCAPSPQGLHCYFYGEEEAGASECTCEMSLGTCDPPDGYCSKNAGETPVTCSADCNSCDPKPCNDNAVCEPNEHYSWCDDCLCEDSSDGCDFGSDDENPLFCIADVYIPQYTGAAPPVNPSTGKAVNKFNRCPCGDNRCSPIFNENNETCPNDCGYPPSVVGDGVCWNRDGATESWMNQGPTCYAFIGNWADGCATVDCPLPPGENGDGVCQFWNGEWQGGESEDMEVIDSSADCSGSYDCCVPADVYCDDDGVCRTDRREGEYSASYPTPQTCADCQGCDTTCNDDGHYEYTCCEYYCWDGIGNCNVPCSAGDPDVCSYQNPVSCGASDPDQCPTSPQWVGCDPGETSTNCPNDCKDSSVCDGDGDCEPCYGENTANCGSDCKPSGACIVNGICEPVFGENLQTCPQDCPVTVNNPGDCGDEVCWWDVFGSPGSSPPAWETHENCWDEDTKTGDCPHPPGWCGDFVCWPYPPFIDTSSTCHTDLDGPGYETDYCCPQDCDPQPYDGNHVCEPTENCQDNENDCPFPPAKDVNNAPRDDDICQWWAGETPADDDACDPPTVGELQYVCKGTPPRCCACPDVYTSSAFDPSYYRMFTRDSIWTKTFKMTPEVSNSTLRDCTTELSCLEAKNLYGPAGSPGASCWENASNLVCDGCYGGGTNCKNCNGNDTYKQPVTQCGDYTISADECMADPCGAATVASGIKYGGCFNPGGGCTDCYTIWGRGCSAYAADQWNCEHDPCDIENCAWNKAAGQCQDVGASQLYCADVCPPGTCFEDECIKSSKLTLDGCMFTSTGLGCVSCDDVRSCSDVAKASCKANTCRDLKCFWDSTDNRCKDCRGVIHTEGCAGYANITDCIDNPCGVVSGCAWGEEDKCIDCSLINSCQDYLKPCGPFTGIGCRWAPDESCTDCYPDDPLGLKAYGAACHTDPCNVGPCGMVDTNPGFGETWTCMPRGEYKLGCYEAVYSAAVEDEKMLCSLNAMNLTPGGCYWDLEDERCYSCYGHDALDSDASDNDNYPVPACENYDRGREGDNVTCLDDWCDIGPCYWNNTRLSGDRCKKAFSIKPAADQTGWIRSGGKSGELSPNEIDANAGGGPFWVHAGGGADIPNLSEAWGNTPPYPPNQAFCADYREGSIWSELKSYYTVRRNYCYSVQDPVLNACDPTTTTCALGGVGGAGWYGEAGVQAENLNSRRPRKPVGAHGGDGVDDPPYVCGTMCGKYVTPYSDPYSPPILSTTRWPHPDDYFNPYMWAWFNLTVNETDLSGVNEMTITDVYVRSTSLRADSRGIETRGGHYGPNLQGNILPRPSQPYTIFNWFNMPETTSDGYTLEDDTANISVRGNYTANMTLFREDKALQCAWDSCLPRSGVERDRVYQDSCSHTSPCSGCCTSWSGPGYCGIPGCSPTYSDPCGHSGQYANKWEHCEQWQAQLVDSNGNGVCDAGEYYNCQCSSETYYYRCIACWLHEDCSYPIGPNDFTSIASSQENVTDTSSVQADPYGENLTISPPLSGDTSVKITVGGYVDTKQKVGASGVIQISGEPDIISGFTLLVPDVIRLEHITKQYPAEHMLTRLAIASSWDDCPTASSDLTCKDDSGTDRTIACNDYKQYNILGAGENENQVLTCLDTASKREISRFIPLRDPQWAYLYLINNPLNKYYYFVDRYDATDKNYTFRVDVVGLKPGLVGGVSIVKWADAAKNVGTFRNYHEDERFYYDLADLYRQPRDYNVVRLEALPELADSPVQRKTNVDTISLDFMTTMNGEVFYNPSDKSYTLEFWSDNINVSDFGYAKLIIFTNYRNIEIPLVNAVTVGGVTSAVIHRIPVTITCNPWKADAFTTVDFSCTINAAVPNPVMELRFDAPYSQYSGRYMSGQVIPLKTDRSSITVKAKYDGNYNGGPSQAYSGAELIHRTNVTSKGALLFLLRNILVLILAFFVIVGYRWFMKNRLDFEMMIKESGIYEALEDFLGLK